MWLWFAKMQSRLNSTEFTDELKDITTVTWVVMITATNKKAQVRRSDMFTLRSRRLLTKLLARNDHGLAFIHQVNVPLLSQQQVRGITNKSLFQFHLAGVMDPDVAKVCQGICKV